MHYSLKLGILPLVLCLCGCNTSKGIPYTTKNIEHETDKYSVNGEYICIDMETGGAKSYNTCIESEVQAWLEDFETRATSLQNPSDTMPQLQFRDEIKCNSKKIISIITDKYVYISGLHGNTWRSARTYDAENDKELKLSDLFTDSSYRDFLNEKIDEVISENPDEYHDLWEKPVITPKCEDKFFFDSKKNLVIFYEPYELSYYARGVVEIPIPIEKIRGYIKPEYLPQHG